MPKRTQRPRRSVCPVACALDLIGDRWTMLILRDLFVGKSHFHEFLQSPERIATNILAARLARLTEDGLVESAPSAEREGARAHRLTERGRSLLPVLLALRDWGLANIRGTRALLSVRSAAAPSRGSR